MPCLDGVYHQLSQRGYLVDEGHVVVEGIPVQFLVAATPLVEEVTSEASARDYCAETVKVMGPEHLVAIMVELNRPKDRISLCLILEQLRSTKNVYWKSWNGTASERSGSGS